MWTQGILILGVVMIGYVFLVLALAGWAGVSLWFQKMIPGSKLIAGALCIFVAPFVALMLPMLVLLSILQIYLTVEFYFNPDDCRRLLGQWQHYEPYRQGPWPLTGHARLDDARHCASMVMD